MSLATRRAGLVTGIVVERTKASRFLVEIDLMLKFLVEGGLVVGKENGLIVFFVPDSDVIQELTEVPFEILSDFSGVNSRRYGEGNGGTGGTKESLVPACSK
jgi:hypothetical protein